MSSKHLEEYTDHLESALEACREENLQLRLQVHQLKAQREELRHLLKELTKPQEGN